MFSKIFVVSALMTVCQALYLGNLGHSHGSHGHGVSSQSFHLDSSQKSYDLNDDHHSYDHESHENAHPRYQFKYSVSDDVTKDQKSHSESRDGDSVEGEYSLVQPDGKTRTVTYRADKHNGFQAEVRTSGGDDYLQGLQHGYDDFQHHNYLH